MRRPRLKAPPDLAPACYHCVSRVVDRRRVLGEEEKEVFLRFMRLYERLYGLRVLTFCLMSNHFHILVEVPARPRDEELPSDEQLVSLVRQTKGKSEAHWLGVWLKKWRETGNGAAAEAERARYFRRMWDLSEFMKVLKQRFTQWFNGRHKRRGTLWEDRFRSVLGGAGRCAAGDGGLHRSERVAGGAGRGPEGLPILRLRRGVRRGKAGAGGAARSRSVVGLESSA